MIRLFRCMRWSLHSSRTRKRRDSSGEPGIGVEMGLCVGLFLSIHNDGGGLNRKIWMMPGLCRWTSPWTSLRETDGPSRGWGKVARPRRPAVRGAPTRHGAGAPYLVTAGLAPPGSGSLYRCWDSSGSVGEWWTQRAAHGAQGAVRAGDGPALARRRVSSARLEDGCAGRAPSRVLFMYA